MGRALYSSEVQQPERAAPGLYNCGHAEQLGEAVAVLGRADVSHPDGLVRAACPLRIRQLGIRCALDHNPLISSYSGQYQVYRQLP